MRKDTSFWESAILNNATHQQYYKRLMELSIDMFEWKNVPDEIDIRFLELIRCCCRWCGYYEGSEPGNEPSE